MCGCSFLITSDLYLFRTFEFMDSTPQTAEGKLVMTMGKALKDTELAFWLKSLKAKKYQDGNDFTRQSLCKKNFFNHHNCLSEQKTFLPAISSTRSKKKHYELFPDTSTTLQNVWLQE